MTEFNIVVVTTAEEAVGFMRAPVAAEQVMFAPRVPLMHTKVA